MCVIMSAIFHHLGFFSLTLYNWCTVLLCLRYISVIFGRIFVHCKYEQVWLDNYSVFIVGWCDKMVNADVMLSFTHEWLLAACKMSSAALVLSGWFVNLWPPHFLISLCCLWLNNSHSLQLNCCIQISSSLLGHITVQSIRCGLLLHALHGLSVCLCWSWPCRSSWASWGAISIMDLGWPKESCIRWGPRSFHKKGTFVILAWAIPVISSECY